ncbi:MAG: Kelch repeat-containing protein [Planctomycetota bacterium]|jgi:hypothetical protein
MTLRSARFALASLALVGIVGFAACSSSIFDGAEGSKSETGIDTEFGRYGHTQTLLEDGTVLVVGGIKRTQTGSKVRFPDTAELYDPLEQRFARIATARRLRRAFHAAALHNGGTPLDPTDDSVIVAGGIEELNRASSPADEATSSVARIVTGDGTFDVEELGRLPQRLVDLTGHGLADGRVIFIGGRNDAGDEQSTIHVIESDFSTASTTPALFTPRFNHRSVFVPNSRAGWIVVTGGRDDDVVISQREAIDLEDMSVHLISGGARRQYHTLTHFDGGTPLDPTDDAIVETGGLDDVEEDVSSFQDDHRRDVVAFRLVDQGVGVTPQVTVLSVDGQLREPIFFHAAAATLGGTEGFVVGGFESLFFNESFFSGSFIDSDPSRNVARLTYDPSTDEVTVVEQTALRRSRAMHAATDLRDGTVLIGGGINDDRNSVRGAEVLTQ